MTEDTINVVVVHFVAQLSESQKGLYYQARDNAYNDYLTRIDSQLGEVNRATIWDHTERPINAAKSEPEAWERYYQVKAAAKRAFWRRIVGALRYARKQG